MRGAVLWRGGCGGREAVVGLRRRRESGGGLPLTQVYHEDAEVDGAAGGRLGGGVCAYVASECARAIRMTTNGV